MKRYSKFLLFATVLASGFASCADEDIVEYIPEVKPDELLQDEKFNQYDVLKSYVDRTTSPNFKLGAGVTVSSFLEQKQEYVLAVSNFDELTPGNAMKYASIVNNNGEMNFSNVTEFINLADQANLTVYGHTLGWHAQQNNKYLNGLLADKKVETATRALSVTRNRVLTRAASSETLLELDFNDGTNPFNGWGNNSTREIVDGALKITNPSVVNSWEAQMAYDVAEPFEVAQVYKLKFKIKGSTAGAISAGFQITSNYASAGEFGNAEFDTEWKEVELTCTCNAEGATRLIFSFGAFAGDIYIDDFDFSIETAEEEGGIEVPVDILVTNFDDGIHPFGGWGNGSTINVDGGALKITNPSAVNYWEAQMAYDVTDPFIVNQAYKVKFKIKGSVAGGISIGFQNTADYSSAGEFGKVEFDTEWKEVELTCHCTADGATRLIFSFGDYAGDIFIDDFQFFYITIASSTIPLTPEEKRDTLTWAMDNWIRGMMQATAGKVTAWDAVNEPLSGTDLDGDGFYDLQSASRGTVSADDAKNNFYWQDYLGDENYVRLVIQKARTYYAEYGGTEPLRLFINDYNLESDWDDNAKLKSLIHWINVWEADGETKIDGIATQMHVSCYADQTIQESKKAHVEKMLKLMAETRKLVKISELDMGYIDESGNPVATDKMTPEQHQAMADYYQFIVQKYFEIIPADQQYGITQWCITDAPGALGTGWRGGEPVGLWNLNYQRKCTYEGFIKGLQGNAN